MCKIDLIKFKIILLFEIEIINCKDIFLLLEKCEALIK